MASITKYRNTYARWLKQYEIQSFRTLKKTFNDWGDSIPFNMLSEDNYEDIIDMSIRNNEMIHTYVKIYSDIGLKHGARVGRGINRDTKAFVLGDFESAFVDDVRRYLTIHGGARITSVESTYTTYIKQLMSTRLNNGLTVREAAAQIKKIVTKPSFYKWQAMRIARTESGAAANYSAVQASEASGYVMEKVWISAFGSRTRRTPPDKFDHVHMNGKKVDPNEPFVTSRGEELMFPCDPSGSAANIIQCRCTVAFKAKRDENGELIETDSFT